MKPILDINEAAEFLSITSNALHKRKKCIPHSIVGRKVYFRTEDLIKYAMSNPQETKETIESKAITLSFKHRKVS